MTRQYSACLLCGGKGLRLRSLTKDDLPKSLVTLGERTLLQYSVESMAFPLVQELVFAVDYQSEKVVAWVNQQNLLHAVLFTGQDKPGILNAIQCAASHTQGKTLIVCNTDELRLQISLREALAFHENGNVAATMIATQMANLYRHRVLEVREDDFIVSTTLKGESYKLRPDIQGIVNVGLLILEPHAFNYFQPEYNSDWSGIIDPLVNAGQLRAYIDKRIAYFNVGTPDEYYEAEAYLEQYS